MSMDNDLISELKRAVDRELTPLRQMVEYVTGIVMGSDGVATCKGAKSDDGEGHAITAKAAWHLGFSSRPLDGASGVVLKLGGKSGAAFLVGWRNKQYEVSLQKGEVAVWNEAGAVIKLDQNGKITITAKTGQIVEFNGNSYALLKTDDFLTDLAAFMTACAGAGAIVVSSTGVPTGTFQSSASTINGKLGSGAYKSTKAKNG